jgi:hypothetical protein
MLLLRPLEGCSLRCILLSWLMRIETTSYCRGGSSVLRGWGVKRHPNEDFANICLTQEKLCECLYLRVERAVFDNRLGCREVCRGRGDAPCHLTPVAQVVELVQR